MLARRPEDVDALFFDAMNRADLETCVALHEPDARWYMDAGRTARGRAEIGEALKQFLAFRPRFSFRVKALPDEEGATAMLVSDWEMAGTDADGKPVRMAARSTEVVRRQADGTWLYAIVFGGSD
ncbi:MULTISPECIES: YybH family protein [unclassified Rhizobium]|jgi:ketosteroid isomerase-like protein|uniref:YybH family protein n=1 Tax=Rhizobium sp. GCM10022189 TaxID=3252654 RepID=UPI000DDBB5CB